MVWSSGVKRILKSFLACSLLTLIVSTFSVDDGSGTFDAYAGKTLWMISHTSGLLEVACGDEVAAALGILIGFDVGLSNVTDIRKRGESYKSRLLPGCHSSCGRYPRCLESGDLDSYRGQGSGRS